MGSLLYTVIFYPLELLIEFIFTVFTRGFSNIGIAIAGISIAINMLTLPLYILADNMQKEERNIRVRLKPGIDKIKAVFKGDEQYMMLSTFYKQNHYHPAYALRSSLSLIIQVPFFIAAYNFLMHLELLQGLSFFFIPDLGKPDGLLTIGSLSLNLLPILMTVINITAGAIYSKGFPLRDKMQIYLMATLFLVLLYTSPAGLVFYWTLNNLFSLGKNIFYKFKHPLQVLYLLMVAGVIAGSAAIITLNKGIAPVKIGILVVTSLLVLSIPLLLKVGNAFYGYFLDSFSEQKKDRTTLFILSCFLLWLVSGFIIPTNLIASSPIEFSNTGSVGNPLGYLIETIAVFFGIWCVLPISLYAMFGKKIQTILSFLFVGISLTALLNTFVFVGDYGTITALLQFQASSVLEPSILMSFLSLLGMVFCFIGSAFLIKSKRVSFLHSLLTILVVGSLVGGIYTSITSNSAYRDHQENLASLGRDSAADGDLKSFYHLSREGKNVVVLFLDRAINSYFPIIMEQFPEMEKQYAGFTYYPNTVSFGGHTVTGAPPIFGGYEYTPDAMNERSSEKLVTKHNESMLVLPKLFLDAEYSVTVTDPPFSNYKWAGDLTPFETYPKMQVDSLSGAYTVHYKKDHSEDFDGTEMSGVIKKFLPLFSFMKIAMPVVRPILYDDGEYVMVAQKSKNIDLFLHSYAQLYYMDKLVDYEGSGNTYTFLGNNTTHDPILLQAPEYKPMSTVTDTSSPFSVLGLSDYTVASYHINVAALQQVGIWLEKLQQDGMYDNTRIIIVADHGYNLYSPVFSQFENSGYYASYHPLLLVKDFNAQGFVKEDRQFMTLADVPLLVLEDLDVSTVNPFTGKDLYSSVDKEVVHVYETPFEPSNKTTFDFQYDKSYTVSDDVAIESNWRPIQQ